MNLPPADQIVRKYIELRDFLKAETEAFELRMAPVKEAMKTLENAAGLFMEQTKQTSLPTEFGTAYKKPGMRATVEDPASFHAWVLAHSAVYFLTKHVASDQVQLYMDNNGGHPPPGIKVTPYVNINFRSS